MSSRPHVRAAAIVSSLVIAATFAAGAALASATPSIAPPPPPDEAAPPPPAVQMQQPNPIDQFRQTLEQFGSFHSHPLYGQVWKPSEQIAPPGWSPYPICHWQFDREQRTWVFADPTEWGSIVHRHGRWANDPQHGWIWVADANFGPGWVIWRTEADAVSWAPMLPEQLGNVPPRDGWQRQDLGSFNSGCRQSAPPAPVAAPAPVPGPMPQVVEGGPAFVPGGPVFVPGRPIFVPGRPIFVPGRPPVFGGLPPICATGIRPSWCRPICAVRPFAPGCRRPGGPFAGGPFAGGPFAGGGPRPIDQICAVNPNLPRCRRPGPVVGGVQLPPGATPGPLGSLCARNPAHPACRPQMRPFRPGVMAGRPIRPVFVRPMGHGRFVTPGRFTGPGRFMARPGPHRPFVGRLAGPRFAMGHRGGRAFRR